MAVISQICGEGLLWAAERIRNPPGAESAGGPLDSTLAGGTKTVASTCLTRGLSPSGSSCPRRPVRASAL